MGGRTEAVRTTGRLTHRFVSSPSLSRGRDKHFIAISFSTPVQKYPRAASFKDLILSNLFMSVQNAKPTGSNIFAGLCTRAEFLSVGRTSKESLELHAATKGFFIQIKSKTLRQQQLIANQNWHLEFGVSGATLREIIKITQCAILLCCQKEEEKKTKNKRQI